MKATFFEKKSRFFVKKRFSWLYAVLMLFLFMGFSACGPEEVDGLKIAPSENADRAEVKSMEPMEGGIATPIIIVGDYFGTDTTKLHVKFINEEDPTDVTRANIIGVNGKMIYFNTPKLTYKDNLKVVVSVEDKNGKKKDIEVGTFKYKTEMTVTTVAGIPFASQGAAYTSGGTLTAATFGCPMFICVDADKNVIIVERAFAKGGGNHIDVGLQPRIDNNGTLQGFGGITSLLNEKTNEVRVLKTSDVVNAPTVSPNGKTVYVPLDVKFGYFSMAVEDGYSVKTRAFAQPASPYNNVDNWKFSFVTDPTDSSKYAPVYTVMYNRELIRIDPLTNASEMLAQDIGTNQSSDTYLAFNPKEDNVLYMSVTNNHSIYRIDLKLDSIFAEPFAGIAIVKPEGLRAPYSGAHDGSYAGGVLRDARFAFPRQITFDDEGVMYIADSWNHCIRSIHVGSSPHGGLTVDRVVGTQGNPGHADGGPEISQLNWPMGIAKAFDGTIYIADTRNYAIRKLVVQ
ncbi:MAG TPA: hypothetical protein GXZ87_01190 [Bacteroidales bacterium]|nr:hypothetical protein [Bacteroidales bacterium]